MTRLRLGSNRSGQLLIVAALAIAVIIASTTSYVYELTNYSNRLDGQPNADFILAIKQSTRNVLVSSLANASNGGLDTVLTANLNLVSTTIRNMQQFGLCNLEFTPKNDSNYVSGIRLSWKNGSGASSSCANFTATVYSNTGKTETGYSLNVTSSVTVKGSYYVLSGNQKRVNMTITLLNEDQPAIARSITTYYDYLGNWTQVNTANNPLLTDYGTGVYRLEFTVVTTNPTIYTAIQVHDSRNISVQANETCNLG